MVQSAVKYPRTTSILNWEHAYVAAGDAPAKKPGTPMKVATATVPAKL